MADFEALVEIANNASSQDPSVVKLAEERVKELETDPNFYKELLKIAYNENLALNVRWMATIFFKNGIDKHWRRTVNKILADADKLEIKQALISSFSEAAHEIFLQKAIVIGRIARTDLKSWPDLIPCLLEKVRSEDTTVQYNALITLNHVIKNLVSKRLASDRRVFKQVTSGLLLFVLDLWRLYTNEFVQQLFISQAQGVDNSLRMSLLTLKVLRRLVMEGNDVTVEGHSQALLQSLVDKIPTFLKLRRQYFSVQLIRGKIEKIIVTSMKILLGALDRHPLLFMNVLADALNMTLGCVFSCSEQDLLFELFLVQCANLIKGIIKTPAYNSRQIREADMNSNTDFLRAQQIKQQIFTQNVIAQMCEQLIVKYFPLKPLEIEEWESNPETYLFEEAGESSDFLLRPCTENLFLCLYYEYRQVFTGVLAKLVESLNTAYNTDEPRCLLFREAVYFALGLASYELFGDFDFDSYFKCNLLQELSNSSPGMKLIHRRVLWLIGRWVNVSFSNESRDLLYQVLVKVLDQKEDLVVRVTAARALKDAVDDYQFESKGISMYLKPLWENLFRLLIDVEECDTKMGVLAVISILIERTGREMQPYASELCEYIPHLWFDSADHNMLRCVMVTTLTRVVEALGSESMKLHKLLLPIIQLSTDLKQPAHVYLLDDGLELWLAVMQNTTALSEECLTIFAVLPVLLEQTSENFKTCIAIMESYVLLDAISVVKMYSIALSNVISCLIGQVKDEGNILLTEFMRVILVSLPIEGAIVFEGILVKIFKNVIDDEEYPQVVISYLSLLGYLMLQNSTAFHNVLNKCSLLMNKEPEIVAAKLIDTWLDKVDCMSDDKSRKLTAMVLISLLPSNTLFVNERFALILDTVVNILYDEKQRNTTERTLDNDRSTVDDQTNIGEDRKRKFNLADIVNSMGLLCCVRVKLEESRNSLGNTTFHLLMETMDPVVAKQLTALLS